MYKDLAMEIKHPTYLLQCMNIWNISDINEMSAALIEVYLIKKTIEN